ncbi:Rieske (2Fe-2S) protein [Streptomyces naphthomycinicus]|uniref:Rieske (2Fe-2S) protein n=1 Tax=Streptomyces naphthomycinicus TaxID=2872625 RepID=UPI001CEDF911|nr:Rieske (2Fe-2S) protein [Streptomyces sp. TML10]
MTQPTTRRNVLATSAGALAVGCVGCGGGTSGGGATQSAATSAPLSSSSPSPASPGGKRLATTSDIPEGGGKVFKEQKIVVTQPKKGDFKAFSAICTHQGCTVNRVADGTIDCPCHGSRFHIADGSVAHGPATRPLPEESITVEGNTIHLA